MKGQHSRRGEGEGGVLTEARAEKGLLCDVLEADGTLQWHLTPRPWCTREKPLSVLDADFLSLSAAAWFTAGAHRRVQSGRKRD